MAIGEIAATAIDPGIATASTSGMAVSGANAAPVDPQQVREFDALMAQQGPGAPSGTSSTEVVRSTIPTSMTPASATGAPMDGILDGIRGHAQALNDSFSQMEQKQHALFQSLNSNDYTDTIVSMTEFGLSTATALAKTNIDLGLVQAGNNFCGSMLRIQQNG